jgi:hypothetical protein
MSSETKEKSAMSDECVEDIQDWGGEAQPRGQMSISGEIAGRFDWNCHCDGRFEFCTNGPQGGGASYGGFLRIAFTNFASTCIEVAVDGAEPKPADSIAITFRGDAEIAVVTECFEFLVSKLKSIRKLHS